MINHGLCSYESVSYMYSLEKEERKTTIADMHTGVSQVLFVWVACTNDYSLQKTVNTSLLVVGREVWPLLHWSRQEITNA